MTIFILLEEGDFVAAYRSRKEAEKSAASNEMRNWHVIETTLRS